MEYGTHEGQLASPIAMGAGQIDPNRALDPGLIYDATPQDSVNFMCSMNFTRKQILAVTRSKDYRCSEQSNDLNYPSFVTFYGGASLKIIERKFERIVTNVGNGAAKYSVTVNAPEWSRSSDSHTGAFGVQEKG